MLDLAEQHRIGANYEETRRQVTDTLSPLFEVLWKEMSVSPLAFMDVGQAVAQATLVAYDEGLGTCCMSSPRLEQVADLLELPDTAVPVCLQSVGYPAESWEAGGQTRKASFQELFWEGRYGTAFEPDPAVDEELREEGLIQQEAPLPWREEELRYLLNALGLEGEFLGVIPT